jgi:choline dehydrogenase-like flavoprotein
MKTYDVCIFGAGAGSLSAHLARRSVDVVVVEGGPKVIPERRSTRTAMPYQFENRHIPTMKPGVPGFDSERSRGVGGKTMVWNVVAWRFSHRDFKGYSTDGAGTDWPIDYSDVKPWYDAIENEEGVCGNRDGPEDLPDGNFLPPVPMKCSDEILLMSDIASESGQLGKHFIPHFTGGVQAFLEPLLTVRCYPTRIPTSTLTQLRRISSDCPRRAGTWCGATTTREFSRT